MRSLVLLVRTALILVLSVAGAHTAAAAEGAKLKVGITLHPYYSFVANIVGDRAEVVPLIDSGSNPHNYTPQPDDMKRVLTMDVLVVNGIGHDEWAFDIVKAAGRDKNLKLDLRERRGGVDPDRGGRGSGEGREPAHVRVDHGRDPADLHHREGPGRDRPAERHLLPRQRPRVRGAHSQDEGGVQRPARRRRRRGASAARPCTAATDTSCRSSVSRWSR